MGEKRKFHLPIFSLLEWVMILCCLITFITLGVIYKSSIFEIVSVIFGLFAVTLNMKRKKYAFAVYSLYVLIYGIVSIVQKQYGEGILNLVYNLPVYLYTLYKYYFSKNKNDTSDFKISKLLNDLDKKNEAIEMLSTLVKKKPELYEASKMLRRPIIRKRKI